VFLNKTPIPYGRQTISDQDIQAVVDVLRSDWLTQGPYVERFEQAVADYCGARHAVAVNSATSALHIASLAAGLGEGDVLWTSPNTFVASANCAIFCGASVDFVDINPHTYNLSVACLEEKLKLAEKKGQLPKVVIPVHFAGQSCDMAAIAKLGREYGFTIIEDASHAIGGKYQGESIGNCLHSDMTVFSFHPVKIITTGEGGMVLTNRKDLYDRLVLLRSHGITRDPALMQGENHGPWFYQQIDIGFNYRMTDIHAALGCSQLTRLDLFVARRHELAQRYNMALSNLPLTLPWQHPDGNSAYHLYVIRLHLDEIQLGKKVIFERLRKAGIGVNVHYIPVHFQPYYKRFGFGTGDFPESEQYYKEAVSLPLFAGMTEMQQDRVVSELIHSIP
jgi:UDP-4-amino-4,6-dideoxy-N-acetyl-beta-L-altrosamine transaminase